MEKKYNNFFQHCLYRLNSIERFFSVIAFSLLVMIIFSDVLSRELTGAGLYWATQTGVWANVLIVMAGFGLASSDGAHLRPRFADSWLPDKWSSSLETLEHSFMSLFCAAAFWLAINVVLETRRLGEVSIDLFLPIWPIQLFLPLALAIAAFRHAIFAYIPSLRPKVNNLNSQPDRNVFQ